MRNVDIINEVYARDIKGNLLKQANLFNSRLITGERIGDEFNQYLDIFDLLSRLDDASYQLTNNDIKTLRKYNVLTTINKINKNIDREKSFVAVSDFHSFRYPFDKVKNYYLKEYDVTYILGDATDRGADGCGTGGIQLLVDIMRTAKENPGKLVYIPGNHDEFLLGYLRKKHKVDGYYSYDYLASLYRNGGEKTIEDINRLEREDPCTFRELVEWLGKQPLQRTHTFRGKEYVFGHAIFNQRLYDLNPNYSLNDYFVEGQYSECRRMANDVLWFRKDRNRYNQQEMPTSDKIMVVGHTRVDKTKQRNMNVLDYRGREVKVCCVDGGVSYGGGMLKYDGDHDVSWAADLSHERSMSKLAAISEKENMEVIYQNYILGEALTNGQRGIDKVTAGDSPSEISPRVRDEIVYDKYGHYVYGDALLRNVYAKTFLFDYIVECQMERMKGKFKNQEDAIYATGFLLDMFLDSVDKQRNIATNGTNSEGDFNNFTSHRNAREIARALGYEGIKDALFVLGYEKASDYVNNKFSSSNNKGIGGNKRRVYA